MKIPGRDVNTDTKHNSKLLAKLINYVMQDGKKAVAQRVVYAALDIVDDRSESAPLETEEQPIAVGEENAE